MLVKFYLPLTVDWMTTLILQKHLRMSPLSQGSIRNHHFTLSSDTAQKRQTMNCATNSYLPYFSESLLSCVVSVGACDILTSYWPDSQTLKTCYFHNPEKLVPIPPNHSFYSNLFFNNLCYLKNHCSRTHNKYINQNISGSPRFH